MDPREYSESVLQDLLSADSVLPEQFWPPADGALHLSGERGLMWAVFADGIDSYRRTADSSSPERRAEFQEAELWLLSTDWNSPFSFVNLCETFGFSASGVRGALLRWKHAHTRHALRRQRFRPSIALHAA